MDHLNKFLDKQGFLKYLKKDAEETLSLQKAWGSLAGKVLGEQLSVSFVRGKLLMLETQNPCWVQEIDFYKETLLKKVKNHLGKKTKIEWIRIKVV